MATELDPDWKALYDKLQKETNERLRKQDHYIAKLERKMDKLQQTNHNQLQTLDLRMQQMMGMFQMFMVNQTMGMQPQNQSGATSPTHDHSSANTTAMANAMANTNDQELNILSAPSPKHHALSTPSILQQSQSAINVGESAEHDTHQHHPHQQHLATPQRSDMFSESDEDTASDYDDEGKQKKRKKHKRDKDKKDRERRKKDKKKKHKKSKQDYDHDSGDEHVQIEVMAVPPSSPEPNAEINSGFNRPVPPPPLRKTPSSDRPPLRKAPSSDRAPRPPSRDRDDTDRDRDGRDRESRSSKPHKSTKKSKRNKHRDAQQPQQDKHQQAHLKSQSEDVQNLVDKKLKSKKRGKKNESANVVDFVEIDAKYGRSSPTASVDSRTLLDHLNDLELDVSSSEESLIYVAEDQLKHEEASYNWDPKKGKKKKRKKKRQESEVDSDDDVSILSTSKANGGGDGIDDADEGDSDYSDQGAPPPPPTEQPLIVNGNSDSGDSLHSSEDAEEDDRAMDSGSSSAGEYDDRDDDRKRKKRRKKEKEKEKAKEKKLREKEKKRKEKEKKKKQKKDRERAAATEAKDTTKESKKKPKKQQPNSATLNEPEKLNPPLQLGHINSEQQTAATRGSRANSRETYEEAMMDVDKKRSRISGTIKKIGQKFKMSSKDVVNVDRDDVGAETTGMSMTPKNPFKDMFKGMSKKSKRDVSPEPQPAQENTEEAPAPPLAKKPSLRELTSRSLRLTRKDTHDDDMMVDYGDRNATRQLSQKQKSKKQKKRRRSDSNISAMSRNPDTDAVCWLDDGDVDGDSNAKAQSQTQKKRKKKKKEKDKFNIHTDTTPLEPDLDADDMTPPPSPMDPTLQQKIYGHVIGDEEQASGEDDDEDAEIDGDGNRAAELKDTDSNESHMKKTQSIEEYAKSHGSKSNSKDITIGDEDFDFGVKKDSDFDADIDVGDYDWNGYSKGTKLKQNHSDEEIHSSEHRHAKTAKPADARPQSARSPNSKPLMTKGERGFFAQNVQSKNQNAASAAQGQENRDANVSQPKPAPADNSAKQPSEDQPASAQTAAAAAPGDDKDKSDVAAAKRKGVKKKKETKKAVEKPEKIKPISISVLSDVVGKNSKKNKPSRLGTPTTDTPTFKRNRRSTENLDTSGKNRKNVSGSSTPVGTNRKRSAALGHKSDAKSGKNTKSAAGARTASPRPVPRSPRAATPNGRKTKNVQTMQLAMAKTAISSTPKSSDNEEDDAKEPEVLNRARGQSMRTLIAAAADDDDDAAVGDVEVEYMFAGKKLKSLVPKLDYAHFETATQTPRYRLSVEHVSGFTGYDNLCRNNLRAIDFNDSSQCVLYNVGSLAVIHDLGRNQQIIYRKHTAQITSIALHAPLKCVASASMSSEVSPTPMVKLWNVNTLETQLTIEDADAMVGAVRHLNFSGHSSLLYMTCGENDKNTTLLAYNVLQPNHAASVAPVLRTEFRTIANKNVQIYGLALNDAADFDAEQFVDQFVVFGSNILYWCQVQFAPAAAPKAVKFAHLSHDNVRLKYCKINKLQPKGSTEGKKEKAYHCGLFLQSSDHNIGYYVLGGQSGTIYVGHRNTIICSISAHNGRVQQIQQFGKEQFMTVGYDGMWKVWKIDYASQTLQEISKSVVDSPVPELKDDETEEFEEKRSVPDASNAIIKAGVIRTLCEDTFVPATESICKLPHACHYDPKRHVLYIGTACNSMLSVSNINAKSGANHVRILSSGHFAGIVGVASSPKLDSLIATLSEDGLLRLWNMGSSNNNSKTSAAPKRLDNCVALLPLLTNKQQNKVKSTVIAWSPDGKYIATGYDSGKVSLCTAHPLKKVQEIDLLQFRPLPKNKQAAKTSTNITALCFSYDKNMLAVANCNQLSLFNVEKNNRKCTKWEALLTLKDVIKHIYFSEEDDLMAIITDKYDTTFYTVSVKKRTLAETLRPLKSDIVWWPRLPLTSYFLKGLYQKETQQWKANELIDADIYESLKVAASADKFGVIRLHELPALNEEAHCAFKYHCGQISKLLFIPDQERLISVGLDDRCMIRWNIQQIHHDHT